MSVPNIPIHFKSASWQREVIFVHTANYAHSYNNVHPRSKLIRGFRGLAADSRAEAVVGRASVVVGQHGSWGSLMMNTLFISRAGCAKDLGLKTELLLRVTVQAI